MVWALVERKYAGGLILVSGGDAQFLKIATTIAGKAGLNLLCSMAKPLSDEALANALSLLGK